MAGDRTYYKEKLNVNGDDVTTKFAEYVKSKKVSAN